MLKRNDLLSSGRFKIDSHSKIGSGQFAEVYSAVDITGGGEENATKSGRFCAIKIESEMKTTKREAMAMRNLLGGKGIVEIYEEGVFETKRGKEHPFIAMQLVGENLADLKREIELNSSNSVEEDSRGGGSGGAGTTTTPKTSTSETKQQQQQQQQRPLFSEITIARIAAQTIDALGYTHLKGYVHRDVKPGEHLHRARRYKDETTDKVIAEREDAQFRGTTTYASANAMENREQSPRDDLFSLLYILVELYCGSLPWKRTMAVGVDESEDANYKVMEVPNYLCELAVREDRKQLPKALVGFSRTISQLKYGEVPDYDRLKGLFTEWEEKLLNGRKSGEVRMDWDREVAVKQPSAVAPIPTTQNATADYNNNNNNNNNNNERKRERSPEYNLNTGADPYHPQQQYKRPNITNSPTPSTNDDDNDNSTKPTTVVAGIAATCIIIAETAESSSRNVDAIDAFLRDARDCIELARAKMMTIASSTSAGGGGQGGGMMYNANAKNVAPPPQQNYQQHRPQQQQQQQQWNYNDRRAAATFRSSKNESFFFNDDENENESETNENTNEENVEDDDFEAKVVAENETFFFEEASSSSVPSPADLNELNLLQKANTSSSSSSASSVWSQKPFWCQPWTIVLFGVFCVSLPTLAFDWKFVSVAVAVPISAWWYVFLVLYPKSYASSSFEEKEEDFGR
ncbi:unnamed protein product [Bathycoccus prasinos]